ncbi:MAG: HAMP domain-containing histidine kinase [Ramlibacter sp.]|nr:HAMP domain-containing histidine kinase [Ramlibacter sp.]
MPLWGGGLILATAIALSGSFAVQAWDNLNEDILKNAEELGRITAHTLFPVLLHDDLWKAFEVVSSPYAANPEAALAETLTVLDTANRVYVSSRPEQQPVLSELASLGVDHDLLNGVLPLAADAGIFVRDARDAQHIYVAVPIASDGVRLGTLLVTYNKSLHGQRFLLLLKRSAWITLLVLAVLLPVTAWWGHRMMQPMRLVTERISRIGTGELEPLDPSFYPYRDEMGMLFLAYEEMVSKLREKAEFEKEVVESERMAAVGRLSASVAHEINNPLGGMLNAISTLKRHGPADPLTQRTVSLLERGLSQVRETVAALLIQTKAKNRPLTPNDFEDIRILVTPAANKQATQIGWSVVLPDTVSLPATLLRQVLINLMLNAIAAAGRDGRVGVSAHVDAGQFVLEVGNNGKPLLPEQLSRLFEPFTRFSEQGHGLGLWICSTIVKELGGTIDAESNLGLTRFTVIIPLDRAHDLGAQDLPD